MRSAKTMLALSAVISLGACQCSVNLGDPPGNGTQANAQSRDETKATASLDTRRFVNSRENAVSEELQRNYVDFSFSYPSTWEVTPQRRDGTAVNFVRVASPEDRGYVAYAFHVGTAYGSGDAERDRADMERELPGIAQRFGGTLTNYDVTRMGPDRLGQYETLSWFFTSSAGEGADAVQLYGRGDIILPPGARRGVLILTMTTNRSSDIRSPEGIARSEAMRGVYESFRLGNAG